MRKNYVFISAIVLSMVIYLLDALSYYLFSDANVTFFEALATGVPSYEIFKRLLMAAIIVIFGFYLFEKINKIILEQKISESTPVVSSPCSFDSNFLSSLSYQIRIPLTAIAGFSELLKNENLTAESKSLYIRYINSSCNFLLLLIKNISDISRIESGQLDITRTECNINKMMDDLLNEFQIRKNEIGKQDVSIVLKKEVITKEFSILTDSERLKQVLNNLLENAVNIVIKGIIEFGYKITGDKMLEFYVRNSGMGLTTEQIETIFTRYNKLSDTENIPFNEVVLRLAISRSLVKLLGGEIKVIQGPGEDTTFYVTIPCLTVEVKPEVIKEVKSSAPGKIDWSDRHVLIVEDVESNYIYLKEVLRPTGINVLWAKNGLEAIDQVNSNKKIDIVLMDILMPEMDGYEASKEIKKIRNELPIIVQTAFLFEEKDNIDKAQYFDGYLTKPIWSPQLISAIEKYFA